MRLVIHYLIGLVFGTGIAISGMMDPAKVANFFDVAGSWDPSLAFVMGGAVLVAFFGYRLVLKRPAPVIDTQFHLPLSTKIDGRLVAGAAIFGVGWGITGLCPGGAIPALGTGRVDVLVFFVMMAAGIWLGRQYTHRRTLLATRRAS
ncbi:DUF6691 family protein [Poseidonocella sedimentorum]|uniref:Sulphur transport domain-containing protein n=1 Tax=Poseidonocella sedimentorum TaxID=871652 RepID=A0A1I6DSW3_9RHOB|nr:DUF6691 family protein [Poseidonocella sedimentorum]SFR08535.1 hypothetical protein SAMN04515673_10586 [Poseidonocella sedimentorum]